VTDWDAIWDGAFESVRRLLAGDDLSEKSERFGPDGGSPPAAVLELVPPVELEPEVELANAVSEPEPEVCNGVADLPVEPEVES
jgi:hypothetical protein